MVIIPFSAYTSAKCLHLKIDWYGQIYSYLQTTNRLNPNRSVLMVPILKPLCKVCCQANQLSYPGSTIWWPSTHNPFFFKLLQIISIYSATLPDLQLGINWYNFPPVIITWQQIASSPYQLLLVTSIYLFTMQNLLSGNDMNSYSK